MQHREAVTQELVAVEERLVELRRQRAQLIEAIDSANSDDEHDPEGATLAWERENLTALIDQALARQDALTQSITRINDGLPTTCADCGQPIPTARLLARPEATRCVPCASSR